MDGKRGLNLTFALARDIDPESIAAFWRANDVTISDTDGAEALAEAVHLHPDLFLAAVDSAGALAGTVWGTFDGRRGYIVHLAVRRDLRRLGLGGDLLERVERAFAARGVRKVHLFVETFQPKLVDTYARRGFKVRDDLVLMSKTIG